MTDIGTLYVVATPIGNLKDITLRALEVLKTVDLIAAEDTRHTLKLLNHFEIKKPLTSYYEHNKQYKGAKIVAELLSGKNIALVSDAGTPVISDPGELLIKECVQNSIPIITVPGACAAVSALTLSALNTKRFVFYGFLSAKSRERTAELEQLKYEEKTLVFYEAPHKLRQTLKDMRQIFGDRRISVCRELTKKYEQVLRFSLEEAICYFEENEPKGEFVLVLSGSEKKEGAFNSPLLEMSVRDHVNFYIQSGMDKKDAIKKCALDRGAPKRDIYREMID